MTLPPENRPTRCIANNTGRRMSKRLRAFDRSTVVLSYRPHEAEALRALAASISLNGDASPSLSLLSRRALQIYCAHVLRLKQHDPSGFDSEVTALESLTARRSTPKVKPHVSS
jgi:hypothetical protein